MTMMEMQPKVQRTYSDPDLPQLLPLPVRPSSSYEPRPKVKEHAQFTQDIVEAMAEKLGLDIEEHPDFRWVIRDCLLALRDQGWQCRVHEGDLEYVFAHTDESRSYHPIAEAHRKLAERLQSVQQDIKMKTLDPHYRVRQLTYLAIMGETDIRRVTTPKLLEEVMKNMDVNPRDEPYLIQRIKVSIEDCYFRMRKNGPHRMTIENCIDVESLQVNLELDRVGFMKKISPSGLLYCVECTTSLGDVISAGCHDVLCNQCAVETHSTGNRQDVPMVFIEQIHRAGARQNHTLFGLRKAAYNKRLFADNLDRLMGILQRNVERSYNLSPWFIVYDQAIAPSWYNFRTKHQVRADPNNLMDPPFDEVTEEEGEAPSPDEQILRGLPGATLLKDTHTAEVTAKGTVFDLQPPGSQHVTAKGASFSVPPPMHVKFTSPIR